MTRLSRFVKKTLKTTGFLCFSLPVYASNICEKYYKEPKILTNLNYGNVIYKSVPKSDIVKFQNLLHPDSTLGLTVADFKIKYDLNFERYKVDNGVCAVISFIDFSIGYDNLDVFIEDKYKLNSCEYNAIKEHEEGHIAIYQKELKYYGGLLLKELQNIAFDIGPMYFDGAVSSKKVGDKLEDIIFNNDNLNILKSKLKKAVVKENKLYDNADEYKRVKSLCNMW